MQISDLFQQYNLNTASNTANAGNTEGANGVSSAQQLADAVKALPVGSVFEATVNEMKDGEVVLGLSNGETMPARLQADIRLLVGESMFFQVKSNNGLQVEIKPFSAGPEGNPTLLKALEAAGLKSNARNLTLVNTMMEQQMPIDKNSLLAMVRLAGNNAGIKPSTLVEMTKFGIPVTEENAAVFENYKTDQSMMTKGLNQLFQEIPERLGNESLPAKDAVAFHNQIVSLLAGEDAGGTVTVKNLAENFMTELSGNPAAASENTADASGKGQPVVIHQEGVLQPENTAMQGNEAKQAAEAAMQENTVKQQVGADIAGTVQAETAAAGTGTADAQAGAAQNTGLLQNGENTMPVLRNLLNDAELQELNKAIAELGGRKDSSDMTAKQLLNEVKTLLTDEKNLSDGAVKRLFSGKAYQQVLRSALEEEWLLKPQDITDSDKVNEFYARLGKQMNQLQQILSGETGNNPAAQAAADIEHNISFMNVLNQTYTYVQIPLKLANQNTQGDLYVYTNKKNLKDANGELSAFLHLDLEHLGSTDVSVKMLGKSVTTKFYLSDDAAYRLVAENVPVLEQRLMEKGYNCKIDVENDANKVDFVEDFLQKDKPVGGMVHRYSFDMRA